MQQWFISENQLHTLYERTQPLWDGIQYADMQNLSYFVLCCTTLNRKSILRTTLFNHNKTYYLQASKISYYQLKLMSTIVSLLLYFARDFVRACPYISRSVLVLPYTPQGTYMYNLSSLRPTVSAVICVSVTYYLINAISCFIHLTNF